MLLPATGARPRGHGVHQILLLFGSTGDVAHGAWRVLACHAAISRAVCQRLHHLVLIGEGSLRPRATNSAWRAFADVALSSLRVVVLLARDREVLRRKVQLAGAALVSFLGEWSVKLRVVAQEALSLIHI